MKTILLLPLLGLTAFALSSCTCLGLGGINCGGSGSGGSSLSNIGGGSHPITAQGGTGPRHIGLVPTMETLAE